MKNESLAQSWYPVGVSSKLKKGAHKPLRLFENDWLMFRGNDGRVGIVSRFCPHMGTDLANGRVRDNSIMCPLHEWRYNADGDCTKMPKSDLKLSDIKINKLAVEEKYGIIFAFYGETALFEIPPLTDISDPVYSGVRVASFENNFLSVSINGFDTWHFYNIHNRKVSNDYKIFSNSPFHIGISLTLEVILRKWYDYVIKFFGLSKSDIQLDYYGGNLIMVRSRKTGHCAFLALQPGELENTCTLYFVVGIQRSAKNIFTKFLERLKIRFLRFMSFMFLGPDIPVQKNMRPKKGFLSPEKDRAVIQFWDYWEKLPRFPQAKS
jgi:nitrite reductase/ring-hydroxylating ferredoxin subunit